MPNAAGGRYLVFLGAINETKGTHEAIQAALLAKENIVIAGTTYESDDYFRQKIEPFVDGKQVTFIGPVALEQKQQLLADAKAVLMPIQWDDPLPTVAIESLASGTPVTVPEPGTLALFGLGLAGLGFARRRRATH